MSSPQKEKKENKKNQPPQKQTKQNTNRVPNPNALFKSELV